MENDAELNKILNELIRKYMTKEKISLCCKTVYPVGKEVRSEEEIDDLINKCRIVFINFYSPTCPYCELFYPVYISVGSKYKEKAAFIRFNVIYSPEVAWRYNVMATPTTVAIVDGEIVAHIPGYIPENVFDEVVKRILKKASCI